MDSMHGLPDGRIVGANDVWLLERGALRHLFTCPGASRPGCDLEHGSSLSWSPDGTRLALASEQRMYVADASSGRLEPLPGCADCTGESPTWSPDGTSVGFRRGDGIWVVPPAGGAPERVAAIDGPSSFAWSPDGSRLVVGATDGIHLVDLVGGTTRTVFPQADEEGPGDPTWSPDGDRIAWFSTPRVRGAFTAQLWVGDGSGGTTLLRGFGCCVADWEGPLWSPDGRQIALFLDLPRRDELNRSYDLGRRVRVRVVDATTGSIVRTLPGYRPIGWPEPGERATP
jgi:Tol biopolymer transport system component